MRLRRLRSPFGGRVGLLLAQPCDHRSRAAGSLRTARGGHGQDRKYGDAGCFHDLLPIAQRNFVVLKNIVPPEIAGELSE